MKKLIIFGLLLTAAFLLVGCNFPIGSSPTQAPGNPTPNLTLTALFAPGGDQKGVTEVPPTPIVLVVTATPVPVTATPAVSPTATVTPVPPTATVTATAESRSIIFYSKFVSKTPVIDGNWADWKDKAYAYPANYFIAGKSNWKNDKDLEGSFIAGWDEDNLYLAVKVIDDKYVQQATGTEIFKGDMVELVIDAQLLEDFSTASMTADDFQIGLSCGKGGSATVPENYTWYPKDRLGVRPEVVIKCVFADGVWRLEAKIPWKRISVKAFTGERIGFGVSISDNDTSGTKAQESFISAVPGRVYNNPVTWGELILVK